MPKKLSYDYIFNEFEVNNCDLLEPEYINSKTKMKYKCKCGNISFINYSNFQRGKRCLKCSGTEKLTYEFVYNYFKDHGCELLEKEYINANTTMNYICICSNKSIISFSNFKQNRRCKKCSNKEKYTYDHVKEYIESFGYKLLSKFYKNNKTKLKIICINNHIYNISFVVFKKGVRCGECYYINNTGENHPNWKQDRTRKDRNKYLQFNLNKINILDNDPNYNDYLINKNLYEVDHIHPRIAFINNDLDNIYGKKIIQEICNSRENLQIIQSKDNGTKAGKYNQEEFMNWFNLKLEEYQG